MAIQSKREIHLFSTCIIRWPESSGSTAGRSFPNRRIGGRRQISSRNRRGRAEGPPTVSAMRWETDCAAPYAKPRIGLTGSIAPWRLVMAIAAPTNAYKNSPDLLRDMRSAIGRHTDKSFDWDAFPGSAGFPELARAQTRYIGAGGSPKTDDPNALQPGAFTLRLVHQPVGTYAACCILPGAA
jgi:hypothetical protein